MPVRHRRFQDLIAVSEQSTPKKQATLTQISQRAEKPGGNHGNIWNTVLGAAAKELGKLVVRRHGKNHARSNPAV